MKGVRIWMVAVTAYAGLSANVLYGQGTLEYPQTATVDHVDEYHGTQVPGSLSVAGRRRAHVRSGRRLGRGGEQGHVRVPRGDPAARTAAQAADRTVGLRKVQFPFQDRWALLLLPQYGPSEPVGPVHDGVAHERAARVDRSESVVARRDGGLVGAGRERRRQVHRVRHSGRWQ